MMSLRIERVPNEEVKDSEDDTESGSESDHNIVSFNNEMKGAKDVVDTDMLHCVDFQLDEEQYEYSFDGLRPKATYKVTVKCVSILKDVLISKQHQLVLDKHRVIEGTFRTPKRYKQFNFQSDLN